MSPSVQTFSAESKRHSSCILNEGKVIYLHFILKPQTNKKETFALLYFRQNTTISVLKHVSFYFYFVLNLNRRKKFTSVSNSRADLI